LAIVLGDRLDGDMLFPRNRTTLVVVTSTIAALGCSYYTPGEFSRCLAMTALV
jgi:hypothetical protein